MFLRPTSFGADVCALSVRCIDSLGVASVSWMQMYCVGKNALQNVWKKVLVVPREKKMSLARVRRKEKKNFCLETSVHCVCRDANNVLRVWFVWIIICEWNGKKHGVNVLVARAQLLIAWV